MEYQRKVFAVPNSIYSFESIGTNRLLLKGAEAYLEPKQLLDPMNLKNPKLDRAMSASSQKEKLKRVNPPDNPQEQAILDKLDQPQPIQNLLGVCKGDLSVLLELLCQMELEGKVVVSGQMVRKC